MGQSETPYASCCMASMRSWVYLFSKLREETKRAIRHTCTCGTYMWNMQSPHFWISSMSFRRSVHLKFSATTCSNRSNWCRLRPLKEQETEKEREREGEGEIPSVQQRIFPHVLVNLSKMIPTAWFVLSGKNHSGRVRSLLLVLDGCRTLRTDSSGALGINPNSRNSPSGSVSKTDTRFINHEPV